MNSIGGIGRYYPVAAIGPRPREQEETSLFRSEPTPALSPPMAAPVPDSSSEQAYAEAFARMKIALQNRGDSSDTETGISQGKLSAALGGEEQEEDPAVKAFREYMAMTPAEKMRDAILKELGLTEEDVAAMPPERQEAVEKQIAERMKQKADLQAAREIEEQAKGLAGDDESRKEPALLS